MREPKPRIIIKAVNRNSGYVLEGEELTPQMQKHILKSQASFDITFEPDEVVQAREAEEMKVEEEAAKELLDPSKLTEPKLKKFDKKALLEIGTELGLMVDATMEKGDIINEILSYQQE